MRTIMSPHLWRNRGFLSWLVGQFVSRMGDHVYYLAIPILVLEVTGSAFQMGIMAAATSLPHVVMGLWAGALIDRCNQRLLLILSTIGQAVLVAAIPILHYFGALHMAVLFAISLALGCCSFLFTALDQVLLPQLVHDRNLVTANGHMQMMNSLAAASGPALAGMIIGYLGHIASLWIDSATFFVLILVVATVRLAAVPRASESAITAKGLFRDSLAGLVYITKDNLIRTTLIMVMFMNLGLVGALQMVIYHAREVLTLSPELTGLLLMASAAGSFASGFCLPFFKKYSSSGRLILISCLVLSVGMILLPLTKLWWACAGLLALVSGGVGVANRQIVMLIQTSVRKDFLGRVFSIAHMVVALTGPISSVVSGSVVSQFGTAPLFIGTGALIAVLASIGFRTTLGKIDFVRPSPSGEPASMS